MFVNLSIATMREITEATGVDATSVPPRNQIFRVVVETEDGVDHVVGSFSDRGIIYNGSEYLVYNGSCFVPLRIHGWLRDVKCVRISEEVYQNNPNAPLCASKTYVKNVKPPR